MHLIFDFDGTLVDSFDYVVKQFNRLAEDYKFRKLDPEEINELRQLSSKELIALFNIPRYKLPTILFQARKSLHQNITTLKPFNNIPQIIDILFREGFSLGIVSSNSAENILDWLKHHQMHQYFSFIHAGSSFFGKKRALKNSLSYYLFF